MARRKKRVVHTNETKVAAIEELKAGATYAALSTKYNVATSALCNWRNKYNAGEYGKKANGNGHAAPKLKEHVPPGMTPERVFDDRAREAIALLRRADKEVERMKRTGTLKEADAAHLYAGLALRILQGDNGT